MRIVSLTCSNTEIVCHLGLEDQLVGVDDHSDFPAEVVAGLSRVGPDLQIDVERVAELRPDIVLASLTVPGHEKVVESLRSADLPFVAPAPQYLADVARDLRELGNLLEVPERGERAAAAFEGQLERLGSGQAVERQDRPSVMIQWWPKPVIVPGRCSWAQGLLELVGARNVLDEEVESRPLQDEELRGFDVDLIVLAWCGVEAHKVRPDVVMDHPLLAGSVAVRNGHVACVPEAWLGRPSHRLLHGAKALGDLVEAVRTRSPVPADFASAAASAGALRRERSAVRLSE